MNEIGLPYLAAVYIIVLISGCAVNLLRRHFVIQLAGIAFLFTYAVCKSFLIFKKYLYVDARDIYFSFLPSLTGIAACLVSMVLGFWIFPDIRKKIKG
jgi:hypothetical protein